MFIDDELNKCFVEMRLQQGILNVISKLSMINDIMASGLRKSFKVDVALDDCIDSITRLIELVRDDKTNQDT